MKRFVLIVSLSFLLVILAGAVFLYKDRLVHIFWSLQPKPSNLQFSIKPCDKNIDAYGNTNMGIKDSKWLDDGTLVVTANISTFCGGETISYPNYKVTEDRINLTYRSFVGNTVTKCMCASKLEYKIKRIPKNNYVFSLEELK